MSRQTKPDHDVWERLVASASSIFAYQRLDDNMRSSSTAPALHCTFDFLEHTAGQCSTRGAARVRQDPESCCQQAQHLNAFLGD
jgi:hypothetical protein